jgi:glycosyltransferase involved in cell wall biosynthesis
MLPRIMIIADVQPWAWGIKSRYIQKYLKSQFDITIKYINEDPSFITDDFDLYLTYTPSHLSALKHIPRHKKITGITAHTGLHKHIIKKVFDDKVIALHGNSVLLCNELKKSHKTVYYVPNGVDTELFTYYPVPYNPIKRLRVGYVGKPIKAKGIHIIQEAVYKYGKARLLTNTASWQNAYPQQSIQNNLYNQIHAYIVASAMDGTPNPALEAAATGKLIISNRIGNMPEFITEQNGILVKEQKAKYYIEAFKYIKDNPEIVLTMGEQARKTAEKWDWRYQVRNYKKMFNDCLEGKTNGAF